MRSLFCYGVLRLWGFEVIRVIRVIRVFREFGEFGAGGYDEMSG